MNSGVNNEVLSDNKIREYGALELAYIGDTVYDLYVRSHIVRNHRSKVRRLHKLAIGVVNAKSQAEAARLVLPMLHERESEIFRLGKNAKSIPPKNMSPQDYSLATGLEAVIGYLYLTGQTQRTDEIFEIIIEHFFNEQGEA